MEPQNDEIDADIVDYLLGDDYEDNANNSGAQFLSNIRVGPVDLGVTKNTSSSSSSSSSGGRRVGKAVNRDEDREETDANEEKQNEGEANVSQYEEEVDSDAPYDARVRGKKSLAEGVWLADRNAVEVLTLRGNYWRVMGWSEDRMMFLNPEEALLLVERGQLRVKSSADAEKHIPTALFYSEILKTVPLAANLVFAKLKSMDYVVLRHKYRNCDESGQNLLLHSFSCDADIQRVLKQADPKAPLLETVVAFDIYPNTSSWSKKVIRNWSMGSGGEGSIKAPCGHVIVLTGDWTINGRLMAYLLKASKGVPIICAAVLPSGSLILEEFTDGRQSLNWDNEYAIDITYRSKVSMESVIPEKMRPKVHQPGAGNGANSAAGKRGSAGEEERRRGQDGKGKTGQANKRKRGGEGNEEEEGDDDDAASDFENASSNDEGEDDED